MCGKPVAIRLPAGQRVTHPVTGEVFNGLIVPCGKCVLCKIAKTREWALRCSLELPYWSSSIFTTLTYDDEHLPYNASLVKKDLQNFIKRIREELNYPIKYFACGEYGDKGRPHYHLVIFGVGCSQQDYNFELDCWYSLNRIIERNWNKGNVFNGSVSFASMKYVCGYIFKKYGSKVNKKVYDDVGLQIPFQVQSNGIGKRWYDDYHDILWNRGYILFNGVKYGVPRYFIDKMKTEDLDRYKNLLSSGLFKRFNDDLDDWMSNLSNLVGYDLKKASDVDFKQIFLDFCEYQTVYDGINVANREKVEKHRMEMKK